MNTKSFPLSMNIGRKSLLPVAAFLAIGGVLPAVVAAPQAAKETPAKPAAPTLISLHTATEGMKAVKMTAIQRGIDRSGKLVDQARLTVVVDATGVARIESQPLLTSDDKKTPQLLEKPTLAVFDGKEAIEYDADNHKYLRTVAAPDGSPLSRFIPVRSVWMAARGVSEQPTRSAPDETIDGHKVLVLQSDISRPGESNPVLRYRYLIDADTKLIRRMETILWQDEKPMVITQCDFSDWSINPTIAATYFDFIPSSEAEEVKLPKPAPVKRPETLVAGTIAPDFTCLGADNKPVKLSDFKGKVVVLDFWATWCGPCQKSMPHLQNVYQQIKSNPEVTVLALCVSDQRAAYDTWLTKNKDKYTFPIAFDPAERDAAKNIAVSQYKVAGIPTQFVIGKDGKIAAALVGYSGSGDHRLEEELGKLGVSVATTEAAKP